jgi:arylsulfatase A
MPLTSPHTPLAVNEEWKGKSGLNSSTPISSWRPTPSWAACSRRWSQRARRTTRWCCSPATTAAPRTSARGTRSAGHYPSGPLRGYKADAWEGGHRVPFIVRWPGVVEPGSVCGQLVQQADLLATLADILGANCPTTPARTASACCRCCKARTRPVREHAVNCSMSGVPVCGRGRGNDPRPGSGGWTKGGDETQPVQLYNLADDLGETKNLAAEQPEKLAEMKALAGEAHHQGPAARPHGGKVAPRLDRRFYASGSGFR